MFTGSVITMASLVEIALPGYTIRLSDGGIVNWVGTGVFQPIDPVYGTLGGADVGEEAIGDEAPAGRLSMQCPTPAAMVSLARPTNSGSKLKLWIAETDAAGTVVGTPDLQFIGIVDALQIQADRNSYEVTIEFASAAERLFSIREGNVLSSRFHQAAWPGEQGFDFCTGAQTQVPWGVTGPARGSVGVALPSSTLFQAPAK